MANIVELLASEQQLWDSFIKHLETISMIRHTVTDKKPLSDVYYFGIAIDEAIIGHISIKKQPLIVPPSYLIEPDNSQLKIDGKILEETFVQTFAVEEAYHRKGYGRDLQQAAIDRTRELGCYQMRSWSSANRMANYALKLNMGFATLPALYPMPGGKPISGVYFVMRV